MLKLVQQYVAGTLPKNGTVCPQAFDYSWYFPEPPKESGHRGMLGFEHEDSSLLAGARALEGVADEMYVCLFFFFRLHLVFGRLCSFLKGFVQFSNC
jgi:hypothetical protein